MLYRLFAKKAYPLLEEEWKNLLQYWALDVPQWTIKQQVGSYKQAYSFVAQGHGLTLSCYENPLKESERVAKTEVVVACANAPWLSLIARAPQQGIAAKRRLDVVALPANAAWAPWELQSNNQELAEHILSTVASQLTVFEELEAVEFILERQRLYIQWPWLPDTPARQAQLQVTVDFARALTQALDQVVTATNNQDA